MACGTVQANCRGLPKCVTQNTKTGDSVYRRRNHLLCCRWHDKWPVLMLTTANQATWGRARKENHVTKLPVFKPDCVLDYNKNMGGVDVSDQLQEYYTFQRKTMKCWKKILFVLA